MSTWHEHHVNRTWNVHRSPMLQSSWNPRMTKPKFLSPHSKPWKGQNSLLTIASWAYGKQGMNSKKKTEDISCRKRHWYQAFGSYKKKKGNRKLKECLSGFLLLKIKKENKPKKSVHESHEKRIGRTGMNEESGDTEKKQSEYGCEAWNFYVFLPWDQPHSEGAVGWGWGDNPGMNESGTTVRLLWPAPLLWKSVSSPPHLTSPWRPLMLMPLLQQQRHLLLLLMMPPPPPSPVVHPFLLPQPSSSLRNALMHSYCAFSTSLVFFGSSPLPFAWRPLSCFLRVSRKQTSTFSIHMYVQHPYFSSILLHKHPSSVGHMHVQHPSIHHRPQKAHFHPLVRVVTSTTSSTNSCFSSICTYNISPLPTNRLCISSTLHVQPPSSPFSSTCTCNVPPHPHTRLFSSTCNMCLLPQHSGVGIWL